MRNPGLFASEENYYYKRILNLVKDGIMPKLITVASKMVKQPQMPSTGGLTCSRPPRTWNSFASSSS